VAHKQQQHRRHKAKKEVEKPLFFKCSPCARWPVDDVMKRAIFLARANAKARKDNKRRDDDDDVF
jgi:hypothetical protein